MKKNKEQTNVPALRFPEFRGSGGWVNSQIGDKLDILSGYPFKSHEISEVSTGIPILRGINITEGYIRHNQDIDRFFLGVVKPLEKYLLLENDLVIGMDGSKVGKNSALIDKKDEGALLIQRVARLRSTCLHTIKFVFQHIHSNIFHSYVDRMNTSGGIPHISAKQINQFSINFPSNLQEQKKIADCLSSLDELITAESEQLIALKTHKTGLMQQLFPCEGETTPKLRFPEFQNDGEWEEKKLEGMGELISGLTYKPEDIRDRGLLVLRSSNIQDSKISLKDNVYVRSDICGAKLSKPNDILICVRNGSKSLIGKNALLPSYLPSSTHGAFMTVFRANFPEFVYQIFQTYQFTHQVQADLGATINSINSKHLKKYSFFVPKSRMEQQKIADCLSSLDALIAAQAEKIEQLKQHKKGLMQQLFPSMDGVSA